MHVINCHPPHWVVGAQAFYPSTQEADLREFKANLVYREFHVLLIFMRDWPLPKRKGRSIFWVGTERLWERLRGKEREEIVTRV